MADPFAQPAWSPAGRVRFHCQNGRDAGNPRSSVPDGPVADRLALVAGLPAGYPRDTGGRWPCRPRVTPALLAHLTQLDYVHRFALVAIDAETGQGVAIARYEPAGEGVAEVAVVVHPEWRRMGLASALVLLLAQAAAEHGFHTFSLSTWPGTGPSPRWPRTRAGWAGTSSSRALPSSRSRSTGKDPLQAAISHAAAGLAQAPAPAGRRAARSDRGRWCRRWRRPG